MSKKVALVTGASSGIGEDAALQLHEKGFVVYGAARRTDRLSDLSGKGVRALAMDVTKEESITAGVSKIVEAEGRIDVLVNNAGYGSYGAIEDVEMEEARYQFEVNVFGAMTLTQMVLPHMRKQGSGRVINISSMGGKIYTPLGGWYHGTKFALEALSDCLRLETKPFGIDVILIEPGGIRTEWGRIAAEKLLETSSDGAYSDQAKSVAEALASEEGDKRLSDPSVIGKAIVKAATARKPRTRYAVGFGAKPLIAAHGILPDRAFDALILRAVGGS